jgi:hypothetical protein
MGLHDSLSTYNISYGWKKSQKSKCQFDFRALKIGNVREGNMPHIIEKLSMKAITLF